MTTEPPAGHPEAIVRPAAQLLGVDDLPVAGRILGTGDAARMVAVLEDYLLEIGPEPTRPVAMPPNWWPRRSAGSRSPGPSCWPRTPA
jgi:hypothetical protein